MEPSVRVSVALCTYNGAAYLPQQLRSIREQTRLPDELVICDDRSSDRTPEIVERFAADTPFRVQIHANCERLGSTRNFESAMEKCTGDLILLSDQDDCWSPPKVERMLALFVADPSLDMAFTDAEIVDDQFHKTGRRLWDSAGFTASEHRAAGSGRLFDVLLRHNVVTGATMAVRRSSLGNVLPIDPAWVHDGWIALILSATGKVALVDEPLIQYREHTQQQIGVGSAGLQDDVAASLRLQPESYGAVAARYRSAAEHLHRLVGQRARDTTDAERMLLAAALHYERRSRITTRRGFWPLRGAAELLSGRYHRYSRGWLSAARDAFVACMGPQREAAKQG
jgi:cellulose synthase/poly-beta-1,6-N-acetylglucosamine synthase-like glycosyltransferase